MSLEFFVNRIARTATGAVSPYRICKAGTDGAVAQASAATDKFQGVSGQLGAASGARFDLAVSGIVPVEYGGNVSNGDFLTSDANGKAVVAAAGNRFTGVAFEDGDDGTIGSMRIAHGTVDSDT